ncbi:hypothetical protein ACQPW1_04260 [Nocardia sp. CA-128927]|uniref:hypothetical protein n=1 Tax=Nocardia sp. CA-128927 TaxID=3239975 RepID=UPI003D98763F
MRVLKFRRRFTQNRGDGVPVPLILALSRFHDQPIGFDVNQIRHKFGHAVMPSSDLWTTTFIDRNRHASAASHRSDDLSLSLLRLIVEVPTALARKTKPANQRPRLVQLFTWDQHGTQDVSVPADRFVHEGVNGHRGTIPVGYDTC